MRVKSPFVALVTYVAIAQVQARRPRRVNFYDACAKVIFNFVEGESLLMGIKDIAVSSGSACTSASLEPSHVLRACGVGDELAHSSIRFGFGRTTTEEEIDFAADQVISAVKRLRELSPLYEMVLEGVDLSTVQWQADH